VLSLQPRIASGAGQSQEEVIQGLCADILSKLPRQFDIEAVQRKYPTTYEESMNTVLAQECIRYNTLLGVIERSLRAGRQLHGPGPRPGALGRRLLPVAEAAGLLGERPRPAAAVPAEVVLERETARVLDLGLLLHAVLPHGHAAELCAQVHDPDRRGGASPVDGVYVHGLFFQGAAWDSEVGVITEARPRELFAPLPHAHLLPIKTVDLKPSHTYAVPVYKTSERAGTLSTTGHSTK